MVGDVTNYSCTTLTHSVADKEITTIEGIAKNGQLHPVQKAFIAEIGPQCGFCTPGQVISAVALLKANPTRRSNKRGGRCPEIYAGAALTNSIWRVSCERRREADMADYKLVGKNFTPPDMVAKVTGAAKYAEDFRAEGMLHAKLLLSPMPHARVRDIDTSAAMKMKGVVAIITPDDVPQFPPPVDPILYKEPTFAGAPILAVAADSEEIAAAAIEAIKVDFEQLKHVVDPLDSLYPGGTNAYTGGNVANVRLPLQTVKWTAKDFDGFDQGKMPMGKPAEEWAYGDLDAGFKKAKVVIERSFQTAGTSHHSIEPRSAMAYWQNGKVYLHGSLQSQSFGVPQIARLCGVKPQDVVFIAEFCGGASARRATRTRSCRSRLICRRRRTAVRS